MLTVYSFTIFLIPRIIFLLFSVSYKGNDLTYIETEIDRMRISGQGK
jgi:hypothetical protein